jgi:hypothetical protein
VWRMVGVGVGVCRNGDVVLMCLGVMKEIPRDLEL